MTVRLLNPPAPSGLLASLQHSAAKLVRDKRGSAAVEFAVIAPLMLTMLFAMIEVTSGVAVDRKNSLAAQTLGDLASRYTSLTTVDITNFTKIGDAILTPYTSTHPSVFQATITQLYLDPKNNGLGRPQWSKGDMPRLVSDTVVVPNDLIARDATNKILDDQYLIPSP